MNAPTDTSLVQDCHRLLTCRSEQKSITLAEQIMSHYQTLEQKSKDHFFNTLLDDFVGSDLLCLLAASKNNILPLIGMREDLLHAVARDSKLKKLDQYFKLFLKGIFSRSLLRFERISWETTPKASLEKIIAYEAIHQIDGMDELQRRLQNKDRRMYAFFHPLLGDEFLIFIEVAFTNGIPNRASAILDENRPLINPTDASTILFYGISKSHAGLTGIPFGNLLIKQVVRTLYDEFKLDMFLTLSPMPGLKDWAEQQIDTQDTILNGEQLALVKTLSQQRDTQSIHTVINAHTDVMKSIVAQYIVRAKTPSGRAVGNVAHFHMSNGVQVHDITLLADDTRMQQSYGCMVNYRYSLPMIEDNIDSYVNDHKAVISDTVAKLLK